MTPTLVVPQFVRNFSTSLIFVCIVAASSAAAQTNEFLMLPDAPDPSASTSSMDATSYLAVPAGGQFGLSIKDQERATHMASRTDKYILPEQRAPRLTRNDKVELGLIHTVSAPALLGWIVSSGYQHGLDGSPNYGVDKGAYGERLGAAALRGTTNEILHDSFMASLLHQDPRYYKMGPRRNPIVRTFYSASRALITRNDEGHTEPNYSLVSGNLLGAAITNAYYPDANRGFGQTARTFGNGMAGSAFSFFANEFLSGAIEAIHLRGHQ